jgi:hypothetical protein
VRSADEVVLRDSLQEVWELKASRGSFTLLHITIILIKKACSVALRLIIDFQDPPSGPRKYLVTDGQPRTGQYKQYTTTASDSYGGLAEQKSSKWTSVVVR